MLSVIVQYWHVVMRSHPIGPNITLAAVAARVMAGWLGGLLLGAERRQRHPELQGRDLGLIALGMTVLTLISAYGFSEIGGPGVAFDPGRLIAQWPNLVAGLAAVLIIRSAGGFRGLTSAITLFLTSVAGIVAGVGAFELLAMMEVITLITLLSTRLRGRSASIRVVMADGAPFVPVISILEAHGVVPLRIRHHSRSGVRIAVRELPTELQADRLATLLEAQPGVVGVSMTGSGRSTRHGHRAHARGARVHSPAHRGRQRSGAPSTHRRGGRRQRVS